ncbi:hypothetical protein DHEL01_v207357 [Diaporthe helianthi]|uniref:Uncharacterized protein n=1 Tax=Diaporthe helianthi TaxID=158607 RepID=A0A2P5HVG3_DIAHE|nr:hypothetical protein DHEL01_v207357 [Diaporthe helianthi]
MDSNTIQKQENLGVVKNSNLVVPGASRGSATGTSKSLVNGASKLTAKARGAGAPKINASGTSTGHGTGQQHQYQQSSTGQTVPGAGRPVPPAQQGHQYVEPPPTSDGYDVTDGNSTIVPKPLLENQIKAVYVEFLGVGQNPNPNAKNHVIFKIDFVSGTDGNYPGGYQGVRINMDVDQDVCSETSQGGGPYQPGTLPYPTHLWLHPPLVTHLHPK